MATWNSDDSFRTVIVRLRLGPTLPSLCGELAGESLLQRRCCRIELEGGVSVATG